jgi:acyl-coenzyme A synthetase/AMP-(fatty) acid ligase
LNSHAVKGDTRLQDLVTSPERRALYEATGLWDSTTLVERVGDHARLTRNRIAVVDRDGSRRITYDRLDRDSSGVASLLTELGVTAGDVVAVQLPNWYECVAIALGILKVGAVINLMLPIYRSREVRHMLNVGSTKVLFTPATYHGFDYRDMVAGIVSEVPALDRHVVVDASDGDPGEFRRILASYAARDHGTHQPLTASNVSELIFTSGTEAEPKAIMHTEQTTNFAVRTAWRSLAMNDGDVVWMPSPIGHSTGFNYGVRMALYHGLRLVLQDRWDAGTAGALIEAEQCTYTLAATTFLRDLAAAQAESPHDLSSMRLFGCGGAPVPPDLVRKAMAVGIGVLRLYGSTEVLVGTWNRPESPLSQKVSSDGPALDDVDVQIWSDDGRRDVRGETGELYTRSASTCVGFFGDPTRTAETFTPDGWVRSGDLAVMDADGYVTVVGRRKEIIIRGGLNVAPREVEDVIMQIDSVRAVAVVGLPHERLGEVGCACVVLEKGASLSHSDLVAHLSAAGLARYKWPEQLRVVDALPMTPTGKTQKHLLVAAIQGHPS